MMMAQQATQGAVSQAIVNMEHLADVSCPQRASGPARLSISNLH